VDGEREKEEIEKESGENVKGRAEAENVAYVIFTSGSTGRPKGVLVEHCNVSALLAGLYPRLSLDANDVWTMCHSYAFDFSVWELWGALLSGARLLIVPARTVGAPVEFRQLLKERGVTLLSLTPSAMSHLIKEVGPEALTDDMALRQLVVGGEAMPRELADELLRIGLDSWNFYGPTETTVWVAIHPVVKAERTIPIGPPISNSQLYVLDAWHQQVPAGVVGELYIGGDNLSRGYLNHPGLTAEKFVPHPFSTRPGARLYATGDLARFLANGEVEFLGRADQQVKIRGYRIETGEIEATLAEHSSIRDCVVVAQDDQQGSRHLVAYIVPVSQPAPSVGELREMLRERLPEYMIPSAWVVLDQIPLTQNGKVDRRALATAEPLRADLTDAYTPPRTPVEEMLVGIWQQLLNVSRVGINDNFFELGGHSLLATQLISRLRELFSVEVGLRSLFEHPTVSGLAEVVEQAMRAAQSVTAPPIVHRSRAEGEELPLSFAQQRLWFLDQLEPDSSAYNIPASVRLDGVLDVAALEHALNEIVRRHESLRTTLKAVNGQPVQMVSPAQPLSLALIDLQELDESARAAEAHRLMKAEARRPFNLKRGPLLRASLLRLCAEEHIALLTMHHIISDGWSMTIVLREVATLYEAFTSGKPSPLANLPVQYPDFTLWQREWFSGEQLEKQLAYWRQHLSGSLPVLALPTDRPRSPALTHRGAHETLLISPDVHSALAHLSQAEGATLYMTTLAAFYILLSRYTGQDDVIVGTDVANRNRSETEALIGFFVNQLVLRANLSGNPTFREFLKQVREVTLLAYAHQDVPFEKLVETLNPDRAASRTPLFQAKIAFQNAPAAHQQLTGLMLSPLNVGGETGMAKFDLLLNLVETDAGLQVSLEYSSDLFDATTIRRMLRNYETLLGSIVAHPDAVVGKLEILTESEREELEAERLRRAESKLKKFKSVKPRVVSLQQGN
jgi:amino acid adenylation domain-containing protein